MEDLRAQSIQQLLMQEQQFDMKIVGQSESVEWKSEFHADKRDILGKRKWTSRKSLPGGEWLSMSGCVVAKFRQESLGVP